MDRPAGSSERFGYEWSRYNEIRADYETQFRKWTPFLGPDDWEGLSVLDVGCGTGRNSLWPLKYGVREATAIDIDDSSLEVARHNLAQYPNATVLKRSAFDIGFEDRFDLAFSIGVIHHLENPELALRQMVKAAKPGGRVLIWVYGYENNEWIVRFADPLRMALFSRLPITLVHHLSLYPSVVLWVLLRLRVGRLAYFEQLRTFSFRHVRSIVFDQMLPRIAHYWRRERVQDLMESAGLKNVRIEWVNQMSWAAIGTK